VDGSMKGSGIVDKKWKDFERAGVASAVAHKKTITNGTVLEIQADIFQQKPHRTSRDTKFPR
jgi:hypothetical protein